MAIASVAFMSREDHRKQIELEEARKAGLAPVEVDEDGKEINPHIPRYISSAPWYLNAKRPSLQHQRKRKPDPNYTKSCYDSGAKTFQADKYRKGACEKNLRHREDTAKYLLNLDVNSAHYDPKTRSMREDPLPDADPNEKFYEGQDVHMQAAPSQTEFLYKNSKAMKEKLKSQKMETILEKYGNAANEDRLPRELLLGQSERQVEYDCAGRIIKRQEAAVPRSKYEKDVFINNHTTVWGSWRKDHQWGYKCCKQTIRNSYCTGDAGIEAVEAASDLMKVNFARKEAVEEDSTPVEGKRLATWGTDVPDDLVLDEKLLADALKKEDQRKREEKDDRKRKYNVKWNEEVTAEDMEAYMMKKVHLDDPMKNFLPALN